MPKRTGRDRKNIELLDEFRPRLPKRTASRGPFTFFNSEPELRIEHSGEPPQRPPLRNMASAQMHFHSFPGVVKSSAASVYKQSPFSSQLIAKQTFARCLFSNHVDVFGVQSLDVRIAPQLIQKSAPNQLGSSQILDLPYRSSAGLQTSEGLVGFFSSVPTMIIIIITKVELVAFRRLKELLTNRSVLVACQQSASPGRCLFGDCVTLNRFCP